MVFLSESYQLKKNIPFLLFSKILRYIKIEDTADEKVLFPKTSAISGIILVYLHWKWYPPY